MEVFGEMLRYFTHTSVSKCGAMEPLERKSHIANIVGAIITSIVGLLCLAVSIIGLWLQIKWRNESAAGAPSKPGGAGIVNTPTVWLLALLFVGLFLVAFNLYRWFKRPKKEKTEIPPLTSPAEVEKKPEQLPPSRPIVVPIRYGKITSGPQAGHSGISLRNDGEPAYNVSANSVTLSGICIFEMVGTPEQLRKGDSELSFACWRNSPSGGTLGSKLYDFMVQHDIDEFAIPVTYRDADFNWYQTDVLLIKDQMARSTGGSESGIRVDWRQKKIADPNTETGNNGEQPDIALVWDWTEDQKRMRGLSETEKTILVHNRSPHEWIYKVQVDPIVLAQKLEFDGINEIAPGKLHETLGRWNNSNSLTRNIAEFFSAPINEQEAQRKGWHYTKTHNRGMSPYFLKIPVRVTYKAKNKEWEHKTTFVFDIGLDTFFERD
jgi:hypothetical protein